MNAQEKESLIRYIEMFPYSDNYSSVLESLDDFFNGFAVMPSKERKAGSTYSAPADSNSYLVDSFIKEKLNFHKWNLATLKNLLLWRLDINYKNLQKLDYLIGENRNHLIQILQMPGANSSSMLQRRTELDKLIATLYQQKNAEQNSVWKDLSMMQKDIAVGVKYFRNLRDVIKALD